MEANTETKTEASTIERLENKILELASELEELQEFIQSARDVLEDAYTPESSRRKAMKAIAYALDVLPEEDFSEDDEEDHEDNDPEEEEIQKAMGL